MNQILTDEEVSVITGIGFEATGRAIEQAILNKLIEFQAAEIEKYKALCDQMGNALAKCMTR